jgi:hypothetical protein
LVAGIRFGATSAATVPAAHDLIRANLHRAPMYNGTIEGSGPRYCPSIEDKIGRFAGKDSPPGVSRTGGLAQSRDLRAGSQHIAPA